jgi:hypothetical protein
MFSAYYICLLTLWETSRHVTGTKASCSSCQHST